MVALALLVSGCASFPEVRQADWTEQPRLQPQGAPPPGGGGGGGGGGQQPPTRPNTPVPPPDGCKDFDPSVVATCLDQVAAVAVLPDGQSALAAERVSGKILKVQPGKSPEEFARIPVDGAGGGGLTGLALSPSYAEDGLVFAYVTTGSDNRVVRIAKGDGPKPVLTGIPRGGRNNGGALARDRTGALLVATGNAGNGGAASDPNSLAGKVLRITTSGKPADGNPNAGSTVVATGLTSPGGICSTTDHRTTWVTDRTDKQDVVYKFALGKPLGTPAWTWPDRPGVAGCAAYSDRLSVALTTGAGMFNLAVSNTGAFTGRPETTLKGTYGQLGGVDLGPDGNAWVGTLNKAGGKPVSSDDRVFVLPPQGGGTGGND
ncbi:PQQ-dependent sugar dehydrogenase [Crossiella sp. SN42]|uniref:PQQ-dependent sugar dehydrogenase n=1 Tax=Crossiella sp. SN42 TaxID=2944808 RepID=UPI00207D1024|nr:PQQ-dependent sugar dehydrogenase [Crossiella sp. SN42]MCO1580890.1 PQQ-dependent sugar dehydrogenase [Crossiella sp. SN42]